MSLPIKIRLPKNFFEKEVRCGYEVSEKLKKIWAVELDLLYEFDRVCNKYGIKYLVFAGTLLGAVRHKGFIPWDDDVDVCLLRSEYEKLLGVLHEFKHPYFLQTPYNDTALFSTHARFRNSETTGVIKGQERCDYNNGIYVDVFVLDSFVERPWCYKIQKSFIRILTILLVAKKNNTSISEFGFKRIFRRLLNYLFYFFPYIWILKLRDCVVKFFNSNSSDDRARVGLVTHINWFTDKYWLLKSEMLKVVRYKFESIEVLGPSDFDSVLKRPYGDYMSFPPVEERGKWHEGVIHFEPEIPYKEYLCRTNDAK